MVNRWVERGWSRGGLEPRIIRRREGDPRNGSWCVDWSEFMKDHRDKCCWLCLWAKRGKGQNNTERAIRMWSIRSSHRMRVCLCIIYDMHHLGELSSIVVRKSCIRREQLRRPMDNLRRWRRDQEDRLRRLLNINRIYNKYNSQVENKPMFSNHSICVLCDLRELMEWLSTLLKKKKEEGVNWSKKIP